MNEVLIMVCPWSLKVFQVLWLQNNTTSSTQLFIHIKDWPTNIYFYGSLNTYKFLEPQFRKFLHVKPGQNGLKCVWERVDIYKVCKPAACRFMKNVTYWQWFKYLANFVKVNILRNSLECLHMIFVSFFFSATICKISN